MAQNQRERTIDQLKSGALSIVIATDVAARGLDVERISHVINYDIPSDTESYVHRIGRTGRAGRTGDAILFVSPREKNMLYAIEKATHSRIELMELPSTEIINNKRIAKFNQKITDTIAAEDLGFFTRLIEQYCHEHDVPVVEAAAALASMVQGETPLLLSNKPERSKPHEERGSFDRDRGGERDRGFDRDRGSDRDRGFDRDRGASRGRSRVSEGKERYRIEVGGEHGVKAGNILGAILNEVGLDPDSVGQISINDSYSTVELPQGMPDDVFHELRKVRVCGRQLRLSKMEGQGGESSPYGIKKSFKKSFGKPADREKSFFTGNKKKRKG